MARKKKTVEKQPKEISQLERAVVNKHLEAERAEIAGAVKDFADDLQAALDKFRKYCMRKDFNIDISNVRYSENAIAANIVFKLSPKWEKLESSKAIKNFLEKQ